MSYWFSSALKGRRKHLGKQLFAAIHIAKSAFLWESQSQLLTQKLHSPGPRKVTHNRKKLVPRRSLQSSPIPFLRKSAINDLSLDDGKCSSFQLPCSKIVTDYFQTSPEQVPLYQSDQLKYSLRHPTQSVPLLFAMSRLVISTAYSFTNPSSLPMNVTYNFEQLLTADWSRCCFHVFDYLGLPIFSLA